MKHGIALIAALFFMCSAMNSQITFFRTYGSTSEQSGYAVKQCFDGGYIVSGYNHPSTQYNFYLLRLDSIGDTLWTRTFGGDNMVGFDVIQTADSGFLVSGYKNSGNPQMHFEKVDAAGNPMWNRNIGSGWAQAVQQTFDGGYIAAGIYLRRTDSGGNTIWSRPLTFQAMYIIQTPDSGYAMAGFLTDSIVLCKTDTAGYVIWRKSYAGTLYNVYTPSNNVMAMTSDGGYILSGMISNSNHAQLLIKTDANGDTLWTRTLPGQEGEGVVQTYDGGYATCGYDSLNRDMQLNKTDANGNLTWSKHYGYSGDDWAQSIRQTTDHGFILAGTSINPTNKVFVVKTDSLGNVTASGITEPAETNRAVVFPDPCVNEATIILEKPVSNASMQVYNSSGQLVQSTSEISGTQIVFHREELPPGIYFISILEDGEIYARTPIVVAE